MEKAIILKENEAREIGAFLQILLTDEKKNEIREIKPRVDMDLLEHYKKELWGS